MDLAGIAALITSVTGLVSVVLTFVVIWRVNHVVKLTNSNFSALQSTLDQSLATNREQAAIAHRDAERRES